MQSVNSYSENAFLHEESFEEHFDLFCSVFEFWVVFLHRSMLILNEPNQVALVFNSVHDNKVKQTLIHPLDEIWQHIRIQKLGNDSSLRIFFIVLGFEDTLLRLRKTQLCFFSSYPTR